MKSSIAILILFVWLLQGTSCKKEINEQRPVRIPPVQAPKDTVAIEEPVTDTTTGPAWPSSAKEVVFDSLTWIFPWYSTLEIEGFGTYIPANASYKVFITRWDRLKWIEVPLLVNDSDNSIRYEYFIETRQDGAGMYSFGSLYIFYYGTDVGDSPAVKVVYW